MKYMGGKARHAKHILPIILKDREPEQWYVEPFVGGANVIDKVDGKRIGADSNYWLIRGLELIRDNISGVPKNRFVFNEKHYRSARDYVLKGGLAPFNDKLVGYAAFALSFGGKFFGGWCRGKNSKGTDRDYVNEQYKAAEKQSPLLSKVDFFCCSYLELEIPPSSLIYCDPPYASTTSYSNKDKFDHDQFWQWCRDKKVEGHTIFISEYNAPDDFICVWEKEVNSSLTKNTGAKKATEKLFTL